MITTLIVCVGLLGIAGFLYLRPPQITAVSRESLNNYQRLNNLRGDTRREE